MKVLFLDIDGVLNHFDFMQNRKPAMRDCGHRMAWLRDAEQSLCEVSMGHLKRVIVETDCAVVISSTWRKYHALTEIAMMFKERGLGKAARNIIGTTPKLAHHEDDREYRLDGGVRAHRHRGREIAAWCGVVASSLRSIAIVDDDSDFGALLRYHVKTNAYTNGLNQEKATELIELLNSPPEGFGYAAPELMHVMPGIRPAEVGVPAIDPGHAPTRYCWCGPTDEKERGIWVHE